MDESQLAEFKRNVRSTYQQMVRISIEPKWARFYDFWRRPVTGFPCEPRQRGLALTPA